MAGTLHFVLGDQLSRDMSSLRDLDAGDVVFLCEVREEATYVRHHKRKIALLFSAMRHFAAELEAGGVKVDYVRLDAPGNSGGFTGELARAVTRHAPRRVVVTEAGEWRVAEAMRGWQAHLGIPVEIRADDRFLCDHATFADWASGLKQLRMEYFYREMRKRTGYLMEGRAPQRERWNFDRENRRPLPSEVVPPQRPVFAPDTITHEVLDLVAARFGGHFGELAGFAYPVTRADALTALEWFVDHALPDFGDYQDAMKSGEPVLFHANLSALMNCGLLSPREVCDRAEAAWRDGAAPINAVEGFIRQILGWREFVRGIYWLKMPGYGEENALAATRPLPDFFWTAETRMNCLANAIGETKANAYAHHIQRLMVIGNFSLLAGLSPGEVQEWYLIVYHDAYEWVEMPNVVGMILFADNGLFASKPYAASGAYIDRMSDYCRGCAYKVREKTGPQACPFNYLYWDFLARNRNLLRQNQRLRRVDQNYDRFPPERQATIARDAARFLEGLSPRHGEDAPDAPTLFD